MKIIHRSLLYLLFAVFYYILYQIQGFEFAVIIALAHIIGELCYKDED